MLGILVGLLLGVIVCRLWCSWVGDEFVSGELRESKGLLWLFLFLVEISKELVEFVGDEWRLNNVVLWLGRGYFEYFYVFLFSFCLCLIEYMFW